jgi:hypothetical protein
MGVLNYSCRRKRSNKHFEHDFKTAERTRTNICRTIDPSLVENFELDSDINKQYTELLLNLPAHGTILRRQIRCLSL